MSFSFDHGIDVIRAYAETLGSQPGVYRMLDRKESVLYVGKAKNLRKRVLSYTRQGGQSNRIQRMMAETVSMVFVTTATESEALLLEANLIKKYKPRYNILMRDDKSFSYILLRTDHPFPQLLKYRGVKKKTGEYYGPFASMIAINETLTVLHKVFRLRSCKDSFFSLHQKQKRPCLQYHIKRCSAPCIETFTKEEDYTKSVKQTQTFLRGKNAEIQKQLAEGMQKASDERDYERAAVYRDRIKALTRIQAQQTIHLPHAEDSDVIAAYQQAGETCLQVFFFRGGHNYGNHAYFPCHDKEQSLEEVLTAFLGQFYATHDPVPHIYLSHRPLEMPLLREALSRQRGGKVTLSLPQRGLRQTMVQQALRNAEEALARKLETKASQRKLIQGIQELFHLRKIPQRIEVYDNSHISGAFAIGAFIVVTPEGFEKKAYRTFKIRSHDLPPGDDYGMMREVLSRRLKGSLNPGTSLPDLILIDGGAGHLSTAQHVLAEKGMADLPLVAIAKGPDRHAGREWFYSLGRPPFQLESHDPLLYFLQRMRDEAHRFAIGIHRHQRIKSLGTSSLDEIPGIGRQRKKALLQHFGSAKGVEEARIEDLKSVEGISEQMAEVIYTFYRNG